MADDFVRLPVDGPGKRLDTESLLVSAQTVHRERMQVAGSVDTEIVDVTQTDPTASDHGLVVRPALPVSPKTDYVTSANLAAGASVDLDATTIAAATTGKLMQLTVGSSVAAKWEVKTRDGAVEVLLFALFTGGGGPSTHVLRCASKESVTLAGAGVDENFRVTVTNLDQFQAADVHATFEWDEV